MRAIVLKSKDYPTAPLAYLAGQIVQNVAVFGSISLDLEVGGLNVHALRASAGLGAKVVWMPTSSSANDMKKRGINKEGITILDGEAKLFPVVEEILDVVKSYQMVLATGHLSIPESYALVDEAMKKGVSKIVFTHPLSQTVGASLDEQRQMAKKGAFIEHCFNAAMPKRRLDPMIFVEAIRAVGVEHCVMSTDLGQAWNPAPAEGMRMMIATMLRCGLSEKEVELLVKVNPATLLGLDQT